MTRIRDKGIKPPENPRITGIMGVAIKLIRISRVPCMLRWRRHMATRTCSRVRMAKGLCALARQTGRV